MRKGYIKKRGADRKYYNKPLATKISDIIDFHQTHQV